MRDRGGGGGGGIFLFFFKLLLCKNRLNRDELLKVYRAKGCLFISIELKATIGSPISAQKSRS